MRTRSALIVERDKITCGVLFNDRVNDALNERYHE